MEYPNHYTNEDLQKCPFHSQLKAAENDDTRENTNTGDWDNERNDAGTDPHRYTPEEYEDGGNDNSGGAGSSGSATTNS